MQERLLLSNLDKPYHFHCNEHFNVPLLIPAYEHIAINRSLLCDCQIEEGNKFLHEPLASWSSADKVKRNMYFVINMALAPNWKFIFLKQPHLRVYFNIKRH